MHSGWTVGAALAALGLSAATTGAPRPAEFLAANPGARLLHHGGRIDRIYGTAFSTGATPEQSVGRFLDRHAEELFGVPAGDFQAVPTKDGLAVQPVMYDPAIGDYRFLAFYYRQTKQGVPVFRSHLTLLVRNEPGFPLVLASPNNIHDLSELRLASNGLRAPETVRDLNRRADAHRSEPELVVYWDDNAGEEGAPRLAYVYVEQIGQPGQPLARDGGTYDRNLVVVDALTGMTLEVESLIHNTDVTGSVQAWTTPGLLPDIPSNPETLSPLPNVRVNIVGGNAANTDEFGNFVIPHSGTTGVTVHSDMRGPSLSNGINNQAGSEIFIDLVVTPPGPADFEHNTTQSEFTTAQVNVMEHTSKIHTWLGDINPAFPGMGRSFSANVNINSDCNAYYDGGSINFYRALGGCANTAYSTVVYHEYGHKIVDDGSNFPSGDYHEGMADCISMVLSDDPIVGQDFFGSGTFVRSGVNNRMYPCNGEGHFCGQVISGAVWDTRMALTVTEPSDYLEIIRSLTVNSVLLHSGGITPGITIDFLTLDDDDSDITNGTPHYFEIAEGFGNHNLDAPPIEFLDFNYPNGLPDTFNTDRMTSVVIEVLPQVGEPDPDSVTLHYDAGSGFQAVPMEPQGSNRYEALVPPVDCGAFVSFYFSAETLDGQPAFDPPDAPDATHGGIGASDVIDLLVDNFETDLGWTVENVNVQDGAWQRGIPAGDGSRGDPTDDFDGSGRCYLTGNRAGNSDLDGGPTNLISPIFDASGDAAISFAYWFESFNGNTDVFTVQVSGDGGSSWTTVATFQPEPTWRQHQFLLSDWIAPSSTARLRFVAVDNPNDSVTEAAIDAVRIQQPVCDQMALEVDPIFAGQNATMRASGADAGRRVYFVYSLSGEGETPVPPLGVVLGLDRPRLAGSSVADGSGLAEFSTPIPSGAPMVPLWIQAAHVGRVSNVVLTQINR